MDRQMDRKTDRQAGRHSIHWLLLLRRLLNELPFLIFLHCTAVLSDTLRRPFGHEILGRSFRRLEDGWRVLFDVRLDIAETGQRRSAANKSQQHWATITSWLRRIYEFSGWIALHISQLNSVAQHTAIDCAGSWRQEHVWV